MKYKDIANLFNVELPHYFEHYFNDFITQYNDKEIFLSENDLKLLQEKTNICDDCLNTIKKVNDKVISNKNYHIAISYFKYVTILERKPWQNLCHDENLLKIEGFEFKTVNLFLVALQEINTLKFKNPPIDLNKENLNAFYGYSKNCFKENGYWGINEFNWNMQCAGGCMFMFGELKFCPSDFCNDFPVITNQKEYITLLGGKFYITKNLGISFNEENSIFQSDFIENDKEYIACRINKDGTVNPVMEHFSKDEYKDYLRGNFHTMDIHIPSHSKYVPEEFKKSCKMALDFYKNYYPDHKVLAIAGYSWLFAPELKEVLKEDSSILACQHIMHLTPTLGSFDETCEFIRPGSSLQEKIKEKIENGTVFHYGIMYIPTEEL